MISGKKRYQEEIAKSAEYLRQALPLMSQQEAALHPVSYAVWYEFVAGINPALKEALEARLNKGEKLDENATHELFQRYIAEIDEAEVERISNALQTILSSTANSANQTGDQANLFSQSLAKWGEKLTDPEDPRDFLEHLQHIVSDTREMQSSVSSLQQRLDASQKEIDKLKQEVRRARKEALSDPLTGLSNRKGLDIALTETLECAQLTGSHPCVLIADIDYFKAVNDNYGHIFGDKVIRAVAHVIKQNVKGKDTAARYGGEEFLVLLPDTPIQGAVALAENIRSAIERTRIKSIGSKETVGNITVSIGIACYESGETSVELINRADLAMYDSKQAGRNRITVG